MDCIWFCCFGSSKAIGCLSVEVELKVCYLLFCVMGFLLFMLLLPVRVISFLTQTEARFRYIELPFALLPGLSSRYSAFLLIYWRIPRHVTNWRPGRNTKCTFALLGCFERRTRADGGGFLGVFKMQTLKFHFSVGDALTHAWRIARGWNPASPGWTPCFCDQCARALYCQFLHEWHPLQKEVACFSWRWG